jgi:hypothetical protein
VSYYQSKQKEIRNRAPGIIMTKCLHECTAQYITNLRERKTHPLKLVSRTPSPSVLYIYPREDRSQTSKPVALSAF